MSLTYKKTTKKREIVNLEDYDGKSVCKLPTDGKDDWKYNKDKKYYVYSGKQFSDLEKKYRTRRITASNFSKALNLCPYPNSTRLDLIEELLNIKTKVFDQASIIRMTRGTKLEPAVRKLYEEKTGVIVEEVGLCIPEWCDRIGASPDGIIEDVEDGPGNIEIKVPGTGDIYEGLSDMLVKGRENFPKYYHEHIKIEHYTQILGTLAITGRNFCDYIVYGFKTKRLYVERIWFNKKYWWEFMFPGLLECIEIMDTYLQDIKDGTVYE